MFTSLLEPEHPPASLSLGSCEEFRQSPESSKEDGWWGGTAVVTGAAGAAPSLHLAVLYNGVFAPAATDQTVRLTLYVPEKNQTIIDEVV